MNDLHMKNKIWLAGHLSGIAHGDRGKVAAAVGITSTQLSRMANIDLGAAPKNTQNIPLPKLLELAKYFRDLPPGIVEALTHPDFKTTIEPKSSVTAEIIKRLDGLPLHLRESLLTIVESWTPAGEGSETAAGPPPPSSQESK